MVIKNKKIFLFAIVGLGIISISVLLLWPEKQEKFEQFNWGSAMSDGYKWPMLINSAMFYNKEGTAISVTDFGDQDAPLTGKWAVGNGDSTSTDKHSLPVSLTARWFSIREKIWFEGDFRLPQKLDSIFKKIDGKQFILGFGSDGGLVVWLKGKTEKIELATFKGKAFEPDYDILGYSKFANTEAFLDSMYVKVGVRERDEMNALEPLANEKAVNGIYTGVYEFIAEQQLGDDMTLIARKLTDTMYIINPKGLLGKYEQGDFIKVSWEFEKRNNPKDTTELIDRQIALNIKLFKRGKLFNAIKNGMPSLSSFYHTDRLTEDGKLLMVKLIKNYLATSADADIRKVVDVTKKRMHFTVHDHFFKGVRGYRIMLIPDHPNPIFSKYIYFHPSKIFSLQEYEDVKQYEN